MSEIRLHPGDTCGLADGFHDGNTRHDSDGARQRAGARWRRVAFTGDAEMDMGRIRADRAPAARALRIAALGALLALGLVAGGCTAPIPQCHAIVNGVRYDADNSGPAWCAQLEDAAHLLNVQLFTGARRDRAPACDAVSCVDLGDDAIRVSLNRDLARQPIGAGGAAVWLDIGAQSCHAFNGTLAAPAPPAPPQWAFTIDATCANDPAMRLEARLAGDL